MITILDRNARRQDRDQGVTWGCIDDMAMQGWMRGCRGRDVGTWAGTREDAVLQMQRGGMETRAGCGDAGKANELLVKQSKRKKKIMDTTEEGDVNAEAGSMQQAGGKGRKGKSTWKRV